MMRRRLWIFVLLVAQACFVSGCTTALWDKSTFARYSRPANPSNLRLSYSAERKDILVQYDEARENDARIRPRCYWLEQNTERVNLEQKPSFVSASQAKGLVSIPVSDRPQTPPASLNGLYAVARPGDYHFILYSGEEPFEPFNLPVYTGRSRTAKKVVLTPFAVTADVVFITATFLYPDTPQLLSGLNQ